MLLLVEIIFNSPRITISVENDWQMAGFGTKRPQKYKIWRLNKVQLGKNIKSKIITQADKLKLSVTYVLNNYFTYINNPIFWIMSIRSTYIQSWSIANRRNNSYVISAFKMLKHKNKIRRKLVKPHKYSKIINQRLTDNNQL